VRNLDRIIASQHVAKDVGGQQLLSHLTKMSAQLLLRHILATTARSCMAPRSSLQAFCIASASRISPVRYIPQVYTNKHGACRRHAHALTHTCIRTLIHSPKRTHTCIRKPIHLPQMHTHTHTPTITNTPSASGRASTGGASSSTCCKCISPAGSITEGGRCRGRRSRRSAACSSGGGRNRAAAC